MRTYFPCLMHVVMIELVMKGMMEMFNKTTVEEISARTGISTATLRRWCDKGLVEHNKTYAGWRWFPEPKKTIKQVKDLLDGEANPEQS